MAAAERPGHGSTWGVYVRLLLAVMLWGGTFVAGRQVAAETGPFAAGFIRFGLASLLLLPFLLRSELLIRTPRGRMATVKAYHHLKLDSRQDGNGDSQKTLFE